MIKLNSIRTEEELVSVLDFLCKQGFISYPNPILYIERRLKYGISNTDLYEFEKYEFNELVRKYYKGNFVNWDKKMKELFKKK